MFELTRSRSRFRIAGVAGLVGLVVALAGCSTSSKSAASAAPSAPPAPGGTTDTNQFGNVTTGGAAESAAAATSSAAAAAGSPAPRSGSGSDLPILTSRQVIYTADITIRAKDIKAAVTAVHRVADSEQGLVFAEQVNLMPKDPQTPGVASATITLKVPPASLDAVLDQVSNLGTELGRNRHADDVTTQVVDVGARVLAAQKSLDRLNTLFAHAGTVPELAGLEQQIAQREGDLDSLLSQQKVLSSQVAQATVTVNLVGTPPLAAPAPPAPKKAHVFGFLRGLRGGWHAFTKTVSALATATGALLPFLVLLALLGVVGLAIRRRLVRRVATDAPAHPEPGLGG